MVNPMKARRQLDSLADCNSAPAKAASDSRSSARIVYPDIRGIPLRRGDIAKMPAFYVWT